MVDIDIFAILSMHLILLPSRHSRLRCRSSNPSVSSHIMQPHARTATYAQAQCISFWREDVSFGGKLFLLAGTMEGQPDTMNTDNTNGQRNIIIVWYDHFEGHRFLVRVVEAAAAATTLHFHSLNWFWFHCSRPPSSSANGWYYLVIFPSRQVDNNY